MNTARQGRKAQWEDLTRREVRDAVIRILSHGGAATLTMENVAAEAGMAKATLYAYFRDKKQLLEWVKEASFEPLRAEIASILDGTLSPDEKIRRVIARQIEYFDENRGLFRVLLWDRQSTLADLKRRRSKDSFQSHIDRLERVLGEGIRAGAFRPLDVHRAAMLLMDAVIATNRRRLLSENPNDVEDDVSFLTGILFHGMTVTPACSERKP